MDKKGFYTLIEKSLRKRNYNMKIDDSMLNIPFRDANIDSLLAFSILSDLEQEFKVQIPDEKIMEMKTLNDLLKLFKI